MWNKLTKTLIAALKALAVLIAIAIALAGIALLSFSASILIAAVIGVLAAIAARRPLPWISRAADNLRLSRPIAVGATLGACAGIGLSIYSVNLKQSFDAAALRANDPQQYLAQLKSANDPRWEAEFKELDKRGYESYLAQQEANRQALLAQKEQTRQASIRALIEKLASIKSDDLTAQVQIYYELSKLDPQNTNYQAKWSELNGKLRVQEAANERAKEAAAKEFLANNSEIRIAYAQQVERNMLESGMDFTVETQGDRHSTLYMKFVLMGRPMVYKFVNDHDFLATLLGLGFKKVIMSDGYDSVWRYRVTETGFKQ